MKKPRKKSGRKSKNPPAQVASNPLANLHHLTPEQIIGLAFGGSGGSIKDLAKRLTIGGYAELRYSLSLEQYKAFLSMLNAGGADPPAYAYRLAVPPSDEIDPDPNPVDDRVKEGAELPAKAGWSLDPDQQAHLFWGLAWGFIILLAVLQFGGFIDVRSNKFLQGGAIFLWATLLAVTVTLLVLRKWRWFAGILILEIILILVWSPP